MSSHEALNIDESSVTMMDVLEQQEAMEEDADTVLGCEDDACTYPKGYVYRQALYSCLTCTPAGGATGRAAVCLGCSLHCHASHNLVELYTKRSFRCDCGNDKMTLVPCKLCPEKEASNANNTYSQNHDGLYCSCHRPYPDPDVAEEDQTEMIQCCVCEDWYHADHLGVAAAPSGELYAEMVCPGCVGSQPVLQRYGDLAVTVVSVEETNEAIDVTSSSEDKPPNSTENGTHQSPEKQASSEEKQADQSSSTTTTEQQAQPKSTCNADKLESSQSKSQTACSSPPAPSTPLPPCALFFPEGWRLQLCRCALCQSLYASSGLGFLLSPNDTVAAYEAAPRRPSSALEQEARALGGVDRVTRVEMLEEYNSMSTALRGFLRHFADNNKVVRDDDIREFFEGLAANKRRRTDGLPPNTCAGL